MAVAPGQEGSEIEWKCGRRGATYKVVGNTGGWQRYQRVAISGGFTEHPHVGTFRITAKSVKGKGALNLRAVRLIPDRTGKVIAEAMAEAAAPKLDDILAVMSRDLVAGRTAEVAAVYADDGVLLGPGGYVVAGREAIGAYWNRTRKVTKWQLDVRSTDGSADLFVQTGRSTLVTQPGVNQKTSVVEFVLTWRQQEDGSWRILSDVYWPAK